MLLSTAKLQRRQLLARRYTRDLEQYPTVFSKEFVTVDVVARELHEEVDWELKDLTGESDLCS